MEATVRALFISQGKGGLPVSLQSVRAMTGGFDGDRHYGHRRKRQILLMSGSVLDELQLPPGVIHENVVVDGLDVMALQEGQQLRLGDALVSVTIPCNPCVQMDRVRYGLQRELQRRRGMFVKVVAPGTVSVGDPVQVLLQQ